MPELASSLVGQISTLFRKEVQLARAEMGEKLGSMAGAVVPMAAGGGLLLGALVLLLLALASLLVHLGVIRGWAELIVGILAAIGGYVLIRTGISKLGSASLVPSRTMEQLSRDAQVAKEQVQ
ncbi:MAG: phage holin family protein [Acetobacteraceae bacterium]|nr:phage holin family protein [Acetobacteraceae bacterium]